jgi:hypothetical protein
MLVVIALLSERPNAGPSARTLKLLDCSPIRCFNFDMERLSFGIDCAPGGKNNRGYAIRFAINLHAGRPQSMPRPAAPHVRVW